MTGSYFSLAPYIGGILFLLIGGLQITASVLLLRERSIGPRLMLAGGIMSVLWQIAFPVLMINLDWFGSDIGKAMWFSSLGTLGSLLFGIGLLLHALHRHAQGNRIAELEAILATRHGE